MSDQRETELLEKNKLSGETDACRKQTAEREAASEPGSLKETEPENKAAGSAPKHSGRIPAFCCGALCGAAVCAAAFLASTGFINLAFIKSVLLETNPFETQASASEATRTELNYGLINLKMRTIQNILSEDYYYTEDAAKVEDGIFTGMMYGLTEEDPYAAYYPAEMNAENILLREGNYYGIGAVVSQDPETKQMTIEEVYEGSPAEAGGMKEGDVICRVDGTDVSGMELSAVVDDYIKGPEDSEVIVTVERDGKELSLTLRRGKVEIPSVYASMLPETESGRKTGYLYVSEFDTATVGQFESGIEQLREEGAEGLIVDLRDNPGGNMDSVLAMLDYLLPDQLGTFSQSEADGADKGRTLLLYTETKHGRADSYYASDGHFVELPIAVLINGQSASASEIFASVAKDYQLGKIVGTTSYGKGIVQKELSLPDGSAIKYTSEQYFSPSGYAVHGKGVTPDVVSEPDEEFLKQGADVRHPDPETDNQLADALSALYR